MLPQKRTLASQADILKTKSNHDSAKIASVCYFLFWSQRWQLTVPILSSSSSSSWVGSPLVSKLILVFQSPLFKNVINLWQFFEGLFSVWQNCEPTWANFMCYWAKVHCCKWQNIERINQPSGHTDAEDQSSIVH